MKGLLFVTGPVLPAQAVRRITEAPHAGPERLVVAAGAPRPPSSVRDGQVVVAEGEEGRDGSNQIAEEDIKGMVAEVPPPGAGDEDGAEEGNDRDAEQVDGRRRGLPSDCRDRLVVAHNPLVAQCRIQRRWSRRTRATARQLICVGSGGLAVRQARA